METIKSPQEQKYEGLVFRLENLIKAKEIEGLEFESIRNTLNLVLDALKKEFKIGQNNFELLGRLENQLYSMDESKLQDSRFETFRSGLASIENIINHEFN